MRISLGTARWLVAGLALFVEGVVPFFAWWGSTAHRHEHHLICKSLLTAAIITAAALLICEFAAASDPNAQRKTFGYLLPAVGADGRTSTSKTVVLLWTIVFADALALLGAVVCWSGSGSVPAAHGGMSAVDMAFGSGSNWDGYFLLLGGPFAAAVAAKGITSSRVTADPTAKSVTSAASRAASPSLTLPAKSAAASDVVTDDAGSVDLVDTQYTLFSFIAIAYFVGALTSNVFAYVNGRSTQVGLPQLPSALLGLTSLAALTYVGNKAIAAGGKIATLTPNPVAPLHEVTASIANLPKGVTLDQVTVITAGTAGSQTTAVISDKSDLATGRFVFSAPADPGDYSVVIVAAENATPPFTLKVEAAG